MLKGFTENGEARNILVTEDGKVKVEGGATSTSINNEDSSPVPVKVISGVNIPTEFEINNEVTKPVPVNVTNEQKVETTLLANLKTIGTSKVNVFEIPNIIKFKSSFDNKDYTYIIDDDILNYSYIILYVINGGSHLYFKIRYSNYPFYYDPENLLLYSKGHIERTYSKRISDSETNINSLNKSGSDFNPGSTSYGSLELTEQYKLVGSNINLEGYDSSTKTGNNEITFEGAIKSKEITSIDIANYSETANITVTVGELEATIGSNIATTLPINKELENISLISTEANTQVQVIVKGVE